MYLYLFFGASLRFLRSSFLQSCENIVNTPLRIKLKKDFHSSARYLFGALLVFYGLKSSEITIFGLDSVVIGWVLVSFYAIFKIKKSALILTLVIYSLFTALYILSAVIGVRNAPSFEYLRIFPSQALCAALIAVLLVGDRWWERSVNSKRIPDYLLILLIAGWIGFIWYKQQYVSYAVRALGGENYLTLSDFVAMIGLLGLSDRNVTWPLRVCWLIVTGFSLLLLGSRASILLFALCAVFAMAVQHQDGQYRLKSWSLIPVLIFIVAIIFVFLSSFDETVTYRLQTLSDLTGDQSLQERMYLQHEFLSQMSTRCFALGCHPPVGNYVHNVISIQQYFGIIGSAFFAVGAFLVSKSIFKGWRPLAPALFLYCLVEFLIARSWVSFVFPVLVGYVVASIYASRASSPHFIRGVRLRERPRQLGNDLGTGR